MALERTEFARRLREIREEQRLTQEAAAGKVGIGLRQYVRWENATADPRISNIGKIEDALGVEPGRLVLETPAAASVEDLRRIEAKLDLLLKRLGS